MRTSILRVIAAVVVGLFGTSPPAALSAEPAAVDLEHFLVAGESIQGRVDAAEGLVTLSFRGKPILVYVFGPQHPKPYVRELYTLRGEALLRDAPPANPNHHGMMYAVRVNGVDFWEETDLSGRQVSAANPELLFGRNDARLPQVTLRHDLRWLPPVPASADATLMMERREFVLTVNPGFEEIALEWRGRFTVGPAVEKVVIHGQDSYGLGMRLAPEFDRVAEFRSSMGQSTGDEPGEDVRPAAWMAMLGRVAEREVMLTVAAHPFNAGVSSFFSMRQPFSYLSATQSLGRQPIEHARGEVFQIRYLALIYPAHQNDDFLKNRFAPWFENR